MEPVIGHNYGGVIIQNNEPKDDLGVIAYFFLSKTMHALDQSGFGHVRSASV